MELNLSKTGLTLRCLVNTPRSQLSAKMLMSHTNMTKNIKLNIPLMSAGMDTVTSPNGHRMAREGELASSTKICP
jgi:hypothetical protein